MRACTFLLTTALTVASAQTATAVEFNFIPQAGTSPEAIAGFAAAGALWSERLHDDIVVNISIGFMPLQTGVLGSTGSERVRFPLADYAAALAQTIQTNLDTEASATLEPLASMPMLINRTSDSPNGSGAGAPYLDNDGSANNSTVHLTRATAKSAGLLDADDTAIDAQISFNSDFNWDFTPGDGIDPNTFSYIAVAAHEIGHALGFVSGVDILDGNSPPQGGTFASDQFVFVAPADLFRYSTESRAQSAIDWAADERVKFFSSGPAGAEEGQFSRGRVQGDGQQASHWRDNMNIGLMDPTAAPGEDGQITLMDVRLFDAIGYETQAEAEVSIACATPGLAIPDGGAAVSSTLDPGLGGAVTALQVDLEIAHTWVGDLQVSIAAPNGATAMLLDRPGRGASGFGCGRDNILARLGDEGLAAAEDQCAAGDAAISGHLTAADALTGLVGASGSSTWTLTVQDNAGQDRGDLVRWCIALDADAPQFAETD